MPIPAPIRAARAGLRLPRVGMRPAAPAAARSTEIHSAYARLPRLPRSVDLPRHHLAVSATPHCLFKQSTPFTENRSRTPRPLDIKSPDPSEYVASRTVWAYRVPKHPTRAFQSHIHVSGTNYRDVHSTTAEQSSFAIQNQRRYRHGK